MRSADSAEGDEDAEFDAPETIEAISNAIAAHGHDVKAFLAAVTGHTESEEAAANALIVSRLSSVRG